MRKTFTLALTLAATVALCQNLPINIPYGTNNIGSTDWWTNTPPYTNDVQPWQGWKANATNAAMAAGLLPGMGTHNAGSDSFGTNTVYNAVTNYVITLSGYRWQTIWAAGNVNFACVTNGPGAASVKVYPAGATRVISFPTNWAWSSTNQMGLTNGQWQTVLTNSTLGFNRAGMLEVECEYSGIYQSNVWARWSNGSP